MLNNVGCIEQQTSIPQISSQKVSEEHETSTHTSSKKRKKTTQHSVTFEHTFHPISPTEFVKEINPVDNNLSSNLRQNQIRFSAQELFLADHNLVFGRFLINAWEHGLNNVEDNAIEMIVQAVQIVLKNILSSCIRRRKHYKVTSEGNFYYDVGCTLRDPTLRNTISRQKLDDDSFGRSIRELTSACIPKKPNDESYILAACEDR